MRAATGQRRVIWHPHVTASNSTLIPVSDPRVPAGLPISVDVVRVKTGRDSFQTPEKFFPVVGGQLAVGSAWVCHDPACPATQHIYIQLILAQYDSAGKAAWPDIVVLPWAPSGWRLMQGGLAVRPDAVRARAFVTLGQDNFTGLCRWFTAGESVTLTP